MPLFNEEFERCSECDNPWFKEEEVILVAKGSQDHNVVVHRREKHYKCTKCGHVQYMEG
jgi:uncharacterized protein with PIN domain